MIKPFFSLLFTIILSSCGGDSTNSIPGTPTPTPTSTPTPTPTSTPTPTPTSTPTPTPTSTPTPIFSITHPRILLNHSATLSTLRSRMNSTSSEAFRLKSYVDSEVQNPGSNWEFRYWQAALMYRLTNQSSYAQFAVNQIDQFVASEEALIASNQDPVVAADSYLYVGDLIGDVSIVYDWCYSFLTPTQRTRWINYMNQSVSNVWNPTTASWGGRTSTWSGWSVDNPSNNYYYSFLRATMMTGLATYTENNSSTTWLNQFRNKINQQLVPTFNSDLTGGGSREGTGYGIAMRNLYDLYYFWEKSTGEKFSDSTAHTQASLAWLLHNTVPTFDALAAIGDHARDSSASFFDYHRDYLLHLMNLYPTDSMSSFANLMLNQSSVPSMANGFQRWVDFMYVPPSTLPNQNLSQLNTVYYGSGTGNLMMRSSWTDPHATYTHFMCGPFTESHAHQDQGAFQFFQNEWLAPTGNIYTSSGIQQSVLMNNLVRIENSSSTPIAQVVESSPCEMKALVSNSTFTYAMAKVTPVYNQNPLVSQVEREFVLINPGVFVVFDRVASSSGTRRVWTLNLPDAPTAVSGDHLTYQGPLNGRMDVYRLAPTGLTYQVNPPTLADGDHLINTNAKRVDVVQNSGTSTQFLHVIGSNNAVTQVTRNDGTGQIGVRVDMNDGRWALVRFNTASQGGTLSLYNSSNTLLQSQTFTSSSSIQTIPIFSQ